MSISTTSNRTFHFWNAVISIVAISFLVWLIYFRPGNSEANMAASKLPAVNACLNAGSAILLILGFFAIRKRKENLHRNLMLAAFVLSALFLISYVYYHSLQGDTRFLGQGWIRPVYFFVLISHILLSMTVLPLVLSTIFFALKDRRATHRRIARFTLPVWLYVSVTGVVIFFMLRAYS
jgi:putative membrane protein